ncbi:putative nucleotidyl transferase [Magnetofaba australis IT-1]|uniref:Putative nucleotidyl transferase n=2 Tax=Magnetofaba TaxID=1472292 RepID=A0A1Y2K6F3_9PROT|nr:putative nucleotidyl transferase [Magnetofaba australis IT-1]
MVLAGGLGTRIRSVLGETPKLLAPLAGEPYLRHLLAWLRGYGANHIVFCLGFGAEAIRDHLAQLDLPEGMRVEGFVESEPLGTAGALRFVLPQMDAPAGPRLIMNGDSYLDADLGAFARGHQQSGADLSMLCVEVPDGSRFGCVELDEAERISRFAEKDPARTGPGLINAGVYLLESAQQDRLMASAGPSLEKDFFAAMPTGSIRADVVSAPFIDFGTPDSYQQAQAFFQARLDRIALLDV